MINITKTELKKVRIYDIKSWVDQKNLKNKQGIPLTVHSILENNLVIILGKKVLIYSKEGMNWSFNNTSKKYIIGLHPKLNKGVYLIPTDAFEVSIQDIIDNCPYKEELLVKTVLKFSEREIEKDLFLEPLAKKLENNFKLILKAITDMDLDINLYYRKGSRERWKELYK